jgi:transposase-like protein
LCYLTLADIIRKHCTLNKIAEADLHSKSSVRYLAQVRAEITLDAIENNVATISAIARHFGRSQPVLSRTMQRPINNRN